MISPVTKKVTVGIIFFLLIANVQATQDISAFFSQILGLEARMRSLEEYTHLTDQDVKLLSGINQLILKNPSLLNESSLYEIDHSISGTKISALKEAAKGFVDVSLARGGQVGLVSFSDTAQIDSFLSKDKYALHANINLYQPAGKTCLRCGILKGIEVLSSGRGANMVLISDGHSSFGDLPLPAARSAASHGIKIYTIALGNNADEILLENISTITGGKFYKIRCKERLKEIYRKIAQETNSAVLVSDVSDSLEEKFTVNCIETGEICQARCLINKIISLLQPLYVTFIFLTGFYLIFLSGSPDDRIKAKSSLTWLILSMCVITLSPFILALLFGISHSLTAGVLAQAPENSQQIFPELISYILKFGAQAISLLEMPALPFILSPYFLLEAIFLMLNSRYFLVLTLSVLFPLTILLYPFPLTRKMGRLLLEQTLIWTFSQVGMALVLTTVVIGINLTNSLSFAIPHGLKMIMELAGLLLLILTPFWLAIRLRGFLP